MQQSERGGSLVVVGFLAGALAIYVAANSRSSGQAAALMLGLLGAALMLSGSILSGFGSVADAVRGKERDED